MKLAYKGTHYAGWQTQPNVETVQGRIESALSKILAQKTDIVGCGRTDAGVHAGNYYAHLDISVDRYPVSEILHKLNSMVGDDIHIQNLIQVEQEAHARFDASSRSYVYKIGFEKDPFSQDLKYRFDQGGKVDFKLLEESVEFLRGKHDFSTFCKTHTDVNNYFCEVKESRWEKLSEGEYHYHIAANRFLRGMVRLIVGMSLNVGMRRIKLAEVISAFQNKERLEKAWSVPALGLYLSEIKYPFPLD